MNQGAAICIREQLHVSGSNYMNQGAVMYHGAAI